MPLPDLALFLLGMIVLAAVFITGWCWGKRALASEIGLTTAEYEERTKGESGF